MADLDPRTKRYMQAEVALVVALLGAGVPGLALAAAGTLLDRAGVAAAGYALALPLMAVVPALIIAAQVGEWRQRRG